MKNQSFLEIYCKEEKFHDRYVESNKKPVDVLIPLINTNPLFEKNLHSFYREIPINRLIIGDAGCTDDSIDIVKKYPRVKVIDQSEYYSQGYCIAELITEVETKWFIYLHADVYLPRNWFNIMEKYKEKYDWFECDRRMVALMEFNVPNLKQKTRALSGSQFGRKDAFKNIIPNIDDDFLQRNEDIIFHELILSEGYKYGRIFDTFHYHQLMNKRGEMEPNIEKISVKKSSDSKWEKRIYNMQVKGIIKYLAPKPYLINIVNNSLGKLQELNALNKEGFKKWVKNTNDIWLKYINIEYKIPKILEDFYLKLRKSLKKILRIIF